MSKAKYRELRYDKMRRHFKHLGDGFWCIKGSKARTVFCVVCKQAFKTSYIGWHDTDRYLKRIPPNTILQCCCSRQCEQMLNINPLVYE